MEQNCTNKGTGMERERNGNGTEMEQKFNGRTINAQFMASSLLFVLYSMKTAFTNQNLIPAEEKLLYEVQGVVFAQRGEAELGKDNPEDLVL